MPKKEKALFTQRHYVFSVLHTPEMLNNSPRLEIALSLLEMHLPQNQVRFLYDTMYSLDTPAAYRERVIREQRQKFRDTVTLDPDSAEELPESFNWRYSERFFVDSIRKDGIVIHREMETFQGGAHFIRVKRYYIIELDRLRQVRIDDLFSNFQGESIREIIYTELRKSRNLEIEQPLTEGGFFNDEPELSFNFFLTQGGLGLNWDPATIAPHYMGEIEIILPWGLIRPYMLNNGMELLTKFGIFLFVG